MKRVVTVDPTEIVPRRRMPIERAELTIDLPGYEDWRVTVRLNPSWRLLEDDLRRALAAGDTARFAKALTRIILDWNFVDEEGEPLPVSEEGVSALPDDLLAALVQAYFQARQPPKLSSTQ
jgi:hypothetical protein